MGRTGRTGLRLDAGHWPQGPDQVAVKNSVAEVLDLHLGGLWDQGGTRRTVVGVVENPQNLRDAFVLVAPGQIGSPDHVDVLSGPRHARAGVRCHLQPPARPSSRYVPRLLEGGEQRQR